MRGEAIISVGQEPLARTVGADVAVPVFGGRFVRYVNLDNAATTPPLEDVWQKLAEIIPWYGSVHRGAGFKSAASTRVLDQSVRIIRKFSDASSESDMVVFGSNTTACVNHLARRLNLTPESTVVISDAEHSSNVLPWKKYCPVIETPADSSGAIDLTRLEDVLKSRHVRLVAVANASNVTGAIQNVHGVARLAHVYGAEVLVDAAQSIAHRKLERRSPESPEHLDYVVYAGHKMYAPFGVGVLVGPKSVFENGWPDQPGGGTVVLIDEGHIVWSDLPSREQGGTPNYFGIVALALTCEELSRIGFDAITAHEKALTDHAIMLFSNLDAVQFYQTPQNETRDRVAVFPFSVSGFNHALVGAYLGVEQGIGVRSGPLCQYALVRTLLKITKRESALIRQQVENGDRRQLYGIVRASCGLNTTLGDLDALADALKALRCDGPSARYEQGLDGEFRAVGWSPRLPFELF
jgi:selenocysteine lyase/cysteine desulfurase